MKITSMSNNYFKTSDLSLTAAVSLSFPISSIEKTENRRVWFFFQKSSELNNFVESYWSGDIRVEPQAFFNQLKNIKTRIYAQ